MTDRRDFLKQTSSLALFSGVRSQSKAQGPTRDHSSAGPAFRAAGFESLKVYQSEQRPSYTSWVSFFPGERGQWYLTCEEVTRPKKPLPQVSREKWQAMNLPVGYDKSPYQMEMVILESQDNLRTWKVLSKEPCRFQHSAGSFAQARTRDGRFLRFVWACYSLDNDLRPSDIFSVSEDDGKTWLRQAPFHDRHFVSYAHRLRMLRDGTLVLALPLSPAWGPGTPLPVRTCLNLNNTSTTQMHLCFSFDQGRTWSAPQCLYGGQNVSETDFVELPSGDLLCINNSIFANPGRQIVYRDGQRFTAGSFEKVRDGRVPETICLTADGILIGCMRAGRYYGSDDLGQTWQPLEGIPQLGPEVYQPWIHTLPDGRIACAGHYGADDPVKKRDQYLSIHLFRLEVLRKTKDTQLELTRLFDRSKNRFRNAYTLALRCDGVPLADKEVEFWYVERNQAGYDSWNKLPLEERMKMGGTLLRLRTRKDGTALVELDQLDKITDVHHSVQMIARFNLDRSDPNFKPAQTPQFEPYTVYYQDPPLQQATSRPSMRLPRSADPALCAGLRQ